MQINWFLWGFICGGCGFYDDFILTCSFFVFGLLLFVRKKEQVMCKCVRICVSVYEFCVRMVELFLCVEMEGLYHINQQLSELLSCILLNDEVMFLVILERKVQISCIFCGFICGGCGFYDFIFDLLLFFVEFAAFL